MRATLPLGRPRPAELKEKSSFAFKAVLALSVIYYARPEDVIPGLAAVPWAKLAGGIALIALIFGVQGRTRRKLPVEIKLLLVMFLDMVATIPFAQWHSQAFNTVMVRFSKGIIVAILVSLCVNRLSELKKLFWVQAAALGVMTLASILAHQHGRMVGVLGGVFENPNDLAINIAINWPFCFAFLLLAKKAWKLALWGFVMFVMVVGTILTYSRSGMLALVLCSLISLYQFGIKGKRLHLIVAAGALGLVLMIAAPLSGLQSKVWIARMESIITDPNQEAQDRGSKEARTELLKMSLSYMVKYPFFGIGPGNFSSFSGSWRVAHNTYTELGAEAGLPALFLFLAVLIRAFINLRRINKSDLYKENLEVRVFTGALFASWGAYMLGAAFSDTQYELFPYFMVAYTSAFYHMACVAPKQNQPNVRVGGMAAGHRRELGYGQTKKTEPAWSR